MKISGCKLGDVRSRAGLVLDRDVNAARNILKRGLEIGRGPPKYAPDREGVTTLLIGDAQAASMKQEAHGFSHG